MPSAKYTLQPAELFLALTGVLIGTVILLMCADLATGGQITALTGRIGAGVRSAAGPLLRAVEDEPGEPAA